MPMDRPPILVHRPRAAAEESVSFDPVADRYDASRGRHRGWWLAHSIDAELARFLAMPARVAEVGAGTAIVAAALRSRGWAVAGLDIAPRMLAVAAARLPRLLVRADAQRLPFGSGRVDAVYGVWMLHVVARPDQVLNEVSRVLRPGGRFLYVPSRPERPVTDVDEVLTALGIALRGGRPRADRLDAVRRLGADAGLVETTRITVSAGPDSLSPAAACRHLEARTWSPLWTLSDRDWTTHVEPALAALRRLPDQDRPRTGRDRYDACVLAKP